MLFLLINAIKIVFLLGFLVFIHEGGHFLVAKLRKIKVKEFAIGFGPTIWQKQGKETKYAIRLIPLGGFVNLLGEEERSDEEGSFSKAGIPTRLAIIVAGGLVNIIFALLVYFILVSSNGGYVSNIVSEVSEQQMADIQIGDEIVKINDKKIRLHTNISDILEKSNGEDIDIIVKRNEEYKIIKVTPLSVKSKSTGIYFGIDDEDISTEILAIYPGSPAETVGLQIKDIIKQVNGVDTENDPYKVVDLISKGETKEIKFTVDRKGEMLDINLEPIIVTNYYIGVVFEKAENTLANNVYYGFWDTVEFSSSIIDNLRRLFTGKISTNQLMGPIGISEVVADTDTVYDFVYILALISLSLGATNLLPFPPLDGGKVVLLIIEGIRRKPLKQEIEIGIQMVGFVILIGLSVYVAYNDILRIF